MFASDGRKADERGVYTFEGLMDCSTIEIIRQGRGDRLARLWSALADKRNQKIRMQTLESCIYQKGGGIQAWQVNWTRHAVSLQD